tara:strand:+ start:6574 stop:7485 length:912 start_codon:yes stop_codon:yes gene_type:complete
LNKDKKNILVAGSNGVIGSFLFENLRKTYNVWGIGTKKFSKINNIFKVDLINREDISKFIKASPQFDILIFSVGLAHKKGIDKEIGQFRLVNKKTLENFILTCKEQDKIPKKIVFFSTISVYGERMNSELYHEDCEKTPLSPYAITKLEAENLLLKKFIHKSWILRLAPVYSKTFNLNINRRTKIRDSFYKVGDGLNKLSLCNVENILKTVNNIIDDKVPAGIYNLSDSKSYSYQKLLLYNKAVRVLVIPKILIIFLYYFGKFLKNSFLKENTIKLIKNNIFPSEKLSKYVDLNASLDHNKDI